MGINLGKSIKINRLRANMTQADLANGIISVSYLSKIENGTAEPTNEIMQLLGEKLNLYQADLEDQITNQTIIRWFLYLLRSHKEEAIRLYDQINFALPNGIDKQLLSLIDIHKLSYYVLVNNLEAAGQLLISLHKSSKKFNDIEKYYYYKYAGNYYYKQLAYKKSLAFYQKAENQLNPELFHQDEETHNLYYLIALAASKNRQTHLCLLYSKKALKYYQNNYELKECAECHILLGISYRRINDIEQSKANYNQAIKLAKRFENNETLILCYQNLGKLFSSIEKSNEAIKYYKKSYELRKNAAIHRKLTPISSLMKEYYKTGDLENTKKWLEIGTNLSNEINPYDSIHVYEFKVYHYLINGFNDSFESLTIDHIIPFFSEKQMHFEASTYIKLLADYYFENRKYKLSATYYKKLVNIHDLS
ncbi:helix-turn-helix transcriptional regulator [Ornithinibacillus sp. BX22]|uniref:Helix-turn-helix transcriptional regulator n=2 Tax=Ornithinibacillus TaxID=484508 RepID=A0A923RIT6_9BACI|nr:MULTISPECIES: helix-turn-helix transcriptional regulator [Ornithinibacillus]MBC5637445.1 helix-turn-helix transcriptional regulator [Ornithinibacillus hominis]MBS3680247.1 helix-turn-helix transcriptional regulator [Ornithinibacillus massiliensis]